MGDPIFAQIISYKEGTLVQGAIRSALKCCDQIFILEGPTEGVSVSGDETDLGRYVRSPDINYLSDSFSNEREKRSVCIQWMKEDMEYPFWILTLDADEILVWGEHLVDWTNQLKPGYPKSGENIVSLKLTEMSWTPEKGFATSLAPRLIHSSMIERYLVGAYMAETTDKLFCYLGYKPSPMPPAYGEPHIHHRQYLRRPERKVLRLHQQEERRFFEDPIGFMKREHDIDYTPPPELLARINGKD